jgi:WD40 repeat protein
MNPLTMSKMRVEIWRILTALLVPLFVSLGCGGGNKMMTGCYVNGTYYPNGNAPNGQCVCPPIGPCTITFPVPAAMISARQTLLGNGQVLLTGGQDNSGTVRDTAGLYDPKTGTFMGLNATMTIPRIGHTGTLLENGRVLLTGGRDKSGAVRDTAEVYDPVAQTFSAITAAMVTPRVGHTATLLPNGQVLLSGGQESSGAVLITSELYDPMANSFTPSLLRYQSIKKAK